MMFGRTGLRIGLFLLGGMAFAAGCAVEIEEAEQIGEAADAVQPKACPAIGVMCIEGYWLKSLPNCNKICVPDQGFECNGDKDCGPIFCITTPCYQPVCRGHECVLPNEPPATGPGNGQGGQPCGDKACGVGTYCCNASCGICAPLDGGCIQIACLQ